MRYIYTLDVLWSTFNSPSPETVEESAEEDEDAEDEEQPPGDEDEEGPGDSIDGNEQRSVDGYVCIYFIHSSITHFRLQ